MIWLFWLGYFLCYVPYTFLIKAAGLASWQILAGSTMGCVGALTMALTTLGWWKHFHFRLPPREITINVPRFYTAGPYRTQWEPIQVKKMVPGPINPAVWSGLATVGIILSTTMGYALHGATAVFMAILMKVGTLVLAPIIDKLTHRRIRPTAKIALSLAITAALITVLGKSLAITLTALTLTGVYLGCYAVKLRFVADRKGDMSFLITDQTVAVMGAALTVIGLGLFYAPVAAGFSLLHRWDVLLIGALSQGTGVFGALIFLQPQETTYCVPLNRSASILATICAAFLASKAPPPQELLGAALVLGAIGVLARKSSPWPSLEDQPRALPVEDPAPARQPISLPVLGWLPSEGERV